MRFKKWPQLPGAGRTRAGHHHGSHTPTSPEAVLLGEMAYHTKQIHRQCNLNLEELSIYLDWSQGSNWTEVGQDWVFFSLLLTFIEIWHSKNKFHANPNWDLTKSKNNLSHIQALYRGSPDSTNFGPPGDRTIVKIVLSGDWFSTKIGIWDF